MTTTITLYLYDERGCYTETREHSLKAPLPSRWTKTPPPETKSGEWAVWNRNRWTITAEEPLFPEPVMTVPQTVSRFQARAALYQAGLLEAVEMLMQDVHTSMFVRIAWQDAQEFKRQSPTVAAFAAALGMTERQVDELFIQAAQIKA